MSNLISVAEAQNFLGISGDTSILETYIDLVEGEIEAYTDRTFAITTYSESLYSGRSAFNEIYARRLAMKDLRPQLFVRNYPINEFIALTSGNTTITASNYVVKPDTGTIDMYTSSTDYKGELKAHYVAGYTTVTAPQGLKSVALQGVRLEYLAGGTKTSGVGNISSESLKDYSVSYGNPETSLYTNGMKSYLANNKVILDKFKYMAI